LGIVRERDREIEDRWMDVKRLRWSFKSCLSLFVLSRETFGRLDRNTREPEVVFFPEREGRLFWN
jgi:hypothetical protein